MCLKKEYSQSYREGMTQLYKLISEAREYTAGSNVKSGMVVIGKLTLARDFANSINDIEYTKLWYDKVIEVLTKAMHMVGKAQNYGDRLEPDNKLCDLLNVMDEHARSWKCKEPFEGYP